LVAPLSRGGTALQSGEPSTPVHSSKLSCHSDYVDPDTAKNLISAKAGHEVLVPLDIRPALGIAKEDRLL